MNKRSRNVKGASRRWLALLLCCLCLLGLLPIHALATQTEESLTQEQPTLTTLTGTGTETPDPDTTLTGTGTETPDPNATVTGAGTETPDPDTTVTGTGTETPDPDATGTGTGTDTETPNPDTTVMEDTPSDSTAAVEELYNRLMSCTSMAQMEAMLNGLTAEEQLLLDSFTDEQNAALSAKIDSFGGYDTVQLDERTVKQGESLTYSLDYADYYAYRIQKDNVTVSSSACGITITASDNTLTVQTSESTPVGTYKIQYGWEYNSFGGGKGFREVGYVSLTVEATQQNPPVTSTKQMTYDKTVTLKDNGNYNLELTLSGAVGTKENKAKVDLVIVIDNSGSMYENNNRLMKAAKKAANTLITTLDNNENIDAQYNIVLFSGTAYASNGNTVDYGTTASGWKNSTDASSYISNVKSSSTGGGATNYEAGLRQAQAQLSNDKVRADATKVVVFLTDGEPTLRVSNYNSDDVTGQGGNRTYGYGNGQTDKGGRCLKAATDYIATMSMNRFYAVGVGGATDDDMKALADAATKATVKDGILAENEDKLTSIFSNIASEIATFLCENVTITDTLARNDAGQLMVDVTDAATVGVKVLDGDGQLVGTHSGTSVNLPATDTNNAATLTASYDSINGVLKLDFPDDYKLEPDYTYVLYAEIAPTEPAYQKFRESGYTNLGDVGTGIHAGQFGFYSNKVANATYTYQGDSGSVTYDMPVVQLNPGKLIITKTFEGLTAEEIASLQDTLKFKVNLTYPDPTGQQPEQEVPLSAFTSANGTYTYTIEGLSPNTAYTVEETGADLEGRTVTTTVTGNETGTVPKGQTATVAYNNSYSLATTTIIIEKCVTGNMGSHSDSFEFTVSGNTVKDQPTEFTLKHGETKEITVNIGDKITVSEKKGEYTASYVVMVGEKSTATGKTDSVTYTVTSDEGQKIIFTNDYEMMISTGILLDTLPYVLILVLVAGGAVLLLRRKRRED